MWELVHKEGWAPEKWCFQTMVLEKTLESHLDSKEIKPVNPKRNQPWIFVGRTDAKAEAPVLWPPDAKTHLKRPWCWERLKAGGEADDRGWDGRMASLIQWIWVWANYGRQWKTRKPEVLQSRGSQSWAWLRNWTTTILSSTAGNLRLSRWGRAQCSELWSLCIG